jgi:hypothetical protein
LSRTAFQPAADVRTPFIHGAKIRLAVGVVDERPAVPVLHLHIRSILDKFGEYLRVVAKTLIVNSRDAQVILGA